MLFGSTDQDQTSSSCESEAASLQFVSLVFAQPTPYPVALAGVHRPGQAGRGHRAAVADQLGSGELTPGRPGGSDGKEQLRMLGAASRGAPPVHLDRSLSVNHGRKRNAGRTLDRVGWSGAHDVRLLSVFAVPMAMASTLIGDGAACTRERH